MPSATNFSTDLPGFGSVVAQKFTEFSLKDSDFALPAVTYEEEIKRACVHQEVVQIRACLQAFASARATVPCIRLHVFVYLDCSVRARFCFP